MEAVDIKKLLQECIIGKEKAWSRFFSLYHSLIVGSVRQVSYSDNEDAVQQVYELLIRDDFRLLRRFGGNEEMFVVYLKRIAQNVAYNHFKKEHKHRERTVSQQTLVATADQMSEEGLWEEKPWLDPEEKQIFLQYLAEIPLNYREVLLYISQGYKHREIAEIMGIPINTSLTWARRGKKLLQKSMGEPAVLGQGQKFGN